MNLFEMFFNDPIILFSFGGLALVLGICTFYVVYFLKHIAQDK